MTFPPPISNNFSPPPVQGQQRVNNGNNKTLRENSGTCTVPTPKQIKGAMVSKHILNNSTLPQVKQSHNAHSRDKENTLQKNLGANKILQPKQIKENANKSVMLSRPILNNSLPQTTGAHTANVLNKESILKEISAALTISELTKIKEKIFKDAKLVEDIGILKGYNDKLTEIEKQKNKECKELSDKVSTFVASDGTPLTDKMLSEKIKGQIPENTFAVNVTTLFEHQFITGKKKARKIELIREWGNWKDYGLEIIQAGFSVTFDSDSIYAQTLETLKLKAGILGSSKIKDTDHEEFTEQVKSAYWSGKKIEIIVPFDFSEEGVIALYDSAVGLSTAINAGSSIRRQIKRIL